MMVLPIAVLIFIGTLFLMRGTTAESSVKEHPPSIAAVEPSLVEFGLSQRLQDAKSTIDRIPLLPLCHRVALNSLLVSCAELKSDYDHPNGMHADSRLNEQKSAFAARMTVCQHDSDGVHIPDACLVFLPTAENTERKTLAGLFSRLTSAKPSPRYPDYERDTLVGLQACREALHDSGKAQGWQTYTANLQQAALHCYAMRGEVEKDEQISLLRALVSTTGNVEQVMVDFLRDAQNVTRLFKDLQKTSRQQFVSMFLDTEQYAELVQRYVQELDDRAEHLKARLDYINAGLGQIHGDLEDAADKSRTVQQRHDELAVSALYQLQQNSEYLDQHRGQLEYIAQFALQALMQTIGEAANDTGRFLQLVNSAAESVANLSADMDGVRNQILEIKEEADKLKSAMSALGFWMSEQITKSVQNIAVFSAYATIYTLGIIPGWHKLLSFPWCLLAAFDIGIVFAMISTISEQPHTFIAHLLNHSKFSSSFLPLLAIITGALFLIGVTSFVAFAFRRRRLSAVNLREIASMKSNGLNFRFPINNPPRSEEKRATDSS